MRKMVVMMFSMVAFIGVAMAEEFNGILKKVDGNKITVQKFKKGEPVDEVTLEVIDKVKVLSTKVNPDTKKAEPADPLEKGLKNETLATGLAFIRVITDDANKVTEIRLLQKKKKEKKVQ